MMTGYVQVPPEEYARERADAVALRDRFAIAALTGLMANPAMVEFKQEYLAARAWQMADLMWDLRQKE